MKKLSSKEFFVVLSLLPALVLSTEGPLKRLRDHEGYFNDTSQEEEDVIVVGLSQQVQPEEVTRSALEAQNHVLDDSLSSNKVTEDPKKNVNTPGYGTEWALTYQSLQQESATINNTVSNVTAQIGSTAFLPCRVGHLGDRQISWIRKRDWHVLTSADVLYTHDQRFSVLHTAGSQDWTLQIKVVTLKDNGTYECQVSTGTGIISLFVELEVVTPEAQIPGHGQYHVNHGSPITLNCLIKQSPSPPQYVSWYHNGDLLNYDRDRPEVKINTEVIGDGEEGIISSPSSNSTLVVENARDEHSGNYTCSAPNTIPASTMVFITEGDKTAAVQRIDPINVGSPPVVSSSYDAPFLTLLVASSLGYHHYLFLTAR